MAEDVAPADVFEKLQNDPQAQLVDVRTDAEWSYVGLPDLQDAGKQPLLIPWQVFPTMQVNGAFVDQPPGCARLQHPGWLRRTA